LLFSLPTTRLTSVVTWSINTLLILLAADFVFTPVFDSATDVTFTRLGAVYPDAVKVVVRYPLSDPGATEHYVRVQWRPVTAAADDRWKDGPILHLGPESDWTNATKLTKLWPSTEYECAFLPLSLAANTLTPTLDTLADETRKILPYPNSPIRFRTFPDSRLSTGSHFRFVVSSCLKPNFPYAPFQNRRIKGFDLLADYLFPEPTVVDTPETVSDSAASDNSTESPIPLEIDVDLHANLSVPAVQDVILAALAERPVPTEFMLFLVNRGFALSISRVV
jgi:alkaline phosphatase D